MDVVDEYISKRRGVLRVLGNLRLRMRWYWRRRFACVYVALWRQDIVARYLHCVGPSRRDDLRTVTLMIGQGDADIGWAGKGTFKCEVKGVGAWGLFVGVGYESRVK